MSAEPWRIGHSLRILRVVLDIPRAALEEAAGLEAGKVRAFEDGVEEPSEEAVLRIIKAMGYTRPALTDARYFYEMLRQDAPRGAR